MKKPSRSTFKLSRRTLGATLASCLMGVLVGTASLTAQAAEYSPRIIRFGYGLAETSSQGQAARFFAEDLAKRTGGKLNMKTFGSASLGDDNRMQDALIGGAQEMMVGSTTTLVGIVDDFGVFDLPFMIRNEKEADAVLDGAFGKRLLDSLAAKGLVGLVYWENGFRNLTNSKHAVASMDDLKGVKLRVMPNPMYIDMFGAMGANTQPLAFAELFTAMEGRTVDGQENPLNTILANKFYEVQKYLSITNHVYTPFIVTASKKWWDGLSADEKAAIQASADASREFQRKVNREQGVNVLGDLKAKGMQVTVFSDAELARMADAARPAVTKWADAKPNRGPLVRDLEAELAKIRGKK